MVFCSYTTQSTAGEKLQNYAHLCHHLIILGCSVLTLSLIYARMVPHLLLAPSPHPPHLQPVRLSPQGCRHGLPPSPSHICLGPHPSPPPLLVQWTGCAFSSLLAGDAVCATSLPSTDPADSQRPSSSDPGVPLSPALSTQPSHLRILGRHISVHDRFSIWTIWIQTHQEVS